MLQSMSRVRWSASLAVCLLPALTGCFSTTRSVMKTHPPPQVLSSTLDAIVKSTADRDNSITSLNASVDVVASVGGGKQGKVTEYTPFSAYILLRKPNDLRFIGLLPAIHTRMFDMATDGKTFTVVMPPLSRAVTGTNAAPPTPAPAPAPETAAGASTAIDVKTILLNLRPSVFIDALTIHSASHDELVSVVSDDRIYQPEPTKKYVVDEPEYDLGIYRGVPGSTELKTQRVIHIGRSTLLPYQQDIYDEKGQLVTVATYDDYKLYGETTFPSKITIRRPIDGLRLVLTVTKLSVNQQLEDEQFAITYDKNYQVQHLP
jgi:outer membrane lipoprotein-sorting protein